VVNINDSVTSQDATLKVTLTAFDPRRGEGRVKIEELRAILRDGGVWRSRTDEDRLQNLRPEKAVRVALYHQPE